MINKRFGMILRERAARCFSIAFLALIPITLASSLNLVFFSGASAAENRIWVVPGDASNDDFITFAIWAEFTEATLGGGIDLDLSGPAIFSSFVPEGFLSGIADPAFTAYDTSTADAEYQIHFGEIDGLSGINLLGTVELAVQGPGEISANMAINSTWGAFYSAEDFQPMSIDLSGASIDVPSIIQVPMPWFWTIALGLMLVIVVSRRSIG